MPEQSPQTLVELCAAKELPQLFAAVEYVVVR
jgi:hypothetical protein